MNTARLELRLPPRTLKQWRAEAKRAGLSLSEWVRRQCERRP